MRCPVCGAGEENLIFEEKDTQIRQWPIRNAEPTGAAHEEPINQDTQLEQYVVCNNCRSRIRAEWNDTEMEIKIRETKQRGINDSDKYFFINQAISELLTAREFLNREEQFKECTKKVEGFIKKAREAKS